MEVAIWSREHQAYWAPDGLGYTRSLKAAGRYSLEDAVAICDRANRGLRDDAEPEETIRPINQGANE